MDSIYFSEEHHQFRAGVREFFEQEVHATAWEKEGRIPREFWKQMGDLGFLGINYPESYGGGDADFFYSVVFLEELGRIGPGGLVTAVSVQQYIATAHIEKFGSEDLKKKYLTGSVSGELVGALAVSEPGAGSDVAAMTTTARREGDHYVINGSKTFISNGIFGDFVVVALKTGESSDSSAVSMIVVDMGTPGFTSTRLNKMGLHSSDTAELSFEDVRIPVTNLIGSEGMGFKYIMDCFQLERLVMGLAAVGGAEHVLEETLDYMRGREAFGRPLTRFQVMRHKIADLASEIEMCRQLGYHASWLHEKGKPAVRECSMFKLQACEVGKRVADECLQCYGGYGYMEEYPIARHFRDARVGTIAGGTSEIMREILAKMIIDNVSYSMPEPEESHTEDLPAIADIFGQLPTRFKGDADLSATVVFDFTSDDNGSFTVSISDGTCAVQPGAAEERDCVVTCEGSLYRDIELGRMTPELAFMSGKIQVSQLPVMMQFTRAFKKFEPN